MTVDDITSGFLDDITITTMLPPDNRQTKSGLLDDVMEDHLHHIWVMIDTTMITVTLAAGQDMQHRLHRPSCRPRPCKYARGFEPQYLSLMVLVPTS